MDQEKETERQAERCRALAQRIVRELTPASIQVLGGSGALAEALEKAGAQLLPENAEQGTAALLVVEDPEWVDLPALQCAQVLLVCTDASAMADCAKQLAAQGLYRDFEWKNRGKAQQTALFCRSAAVQDAQQLLAGYEMTLDDLRERMQQAERTGEEQTAQLERLRSDLSLSRSHEQDLEKTLNNVTSSTFWKMSWPLRYFVSKGRQLAHTFPPFVFLGQLRRVGISGVRAQAKAKKEYAKLFPGRTMRADRFASAELLVRQAADQPAAPRDLGKLPVGQIARMPAQRARIAVRRHKRTVNRLAHVPEALLGQMRHVNDDPPVRTAAHQLPPRVRQPLLLIERRGAAETAAVVPRHGKQPDARLVGVIQRVRTVRQQFRALDGQKGCGLAVPRHLRQIVRRAAERQPIRIIRELAPRGFQHTFQASVRRRVKQAVPLPRQRLRRRPRSAEQGEKLRIVAVFPCGGAVHMQVVFPQAPAGFAALVQRVAVQVEQLHTHPPKAFSRWLMRGGTGAPSSP